MLFHVIHTKWRSYRGHRFRDVTSPYVYLTARPVTRAQLTEILDWGSVSDSGEGGIPLHTFLITVGIETSLSHITDIVHLLLRHQ